jgi:hypothetical protein
MKKIFYCIVLGLLILACDDSDEDKGITDVQGLSVDLSWDEAGVENRDGIGLAIYDPGNVLMYHNYDSATIPNSWVNGQFVCEVEIFSAIDKTDFKIEVQGVNGKTVYTFKNSFNESDPVGYKKTVLLIVKHKDHYTVEVP